MTCTLPDADLQAWLDGELEPSQARRVQRHVAGCPLCQRRLQLWADMRAVLRAQAATHHAPPLVRERIGKHLQRLERRRHRWWSAVAAIAVVTLLTALASVYWWFASPESSSLVSELVHAHAALVRGEIPLTFPSADATAIQQWLGERLPFRPVVPDLESDGFRVLGARTLALTNRAGAAIIFGRAGRTYSLVSLPDPGTLLDVGKSVEMEGNQFQVVSQGGYTLVLWAALGLVYAMVSDDDMDELLEYASSCVRHMRAPT